jgi:NSS family neurotransmitter:Na+ symporter
MPKRAAASDRFTSHWGLILAALGMAIGTGNIWRFPRIMAANGGGTFLLPWLLFLFTWSIPLLVLETGMGRAARRGTVGAFQVLVGRKSAWHGAFVGFCTMAIGFYYCVVAGWCFKYLCMSVTGGLLQADTQQVWDQFLASPGQQAGFHLVTLLICIGIIYRGVSAGIERVNRILIPSLFVLLLLGAVRALTLPGAVDGLNFLFTFRWQDLADHKLWIEAMSQSAWSTGAGTGLILTYAVYARRKQNLVSAAVLTGLGNNSASLLAAIALIPTVFAVLPQEEALQTLTVSGPASTGMTFIYLPQLLQQIAGGAYVLLPLFFLALTFAAISSMLAVLELGTRNLMDYGVTRRRAVFVIFVGNFLLGLPSALSHDFFLNQDLVWGLGLTVSGLFFAMAARAIGRRRLLRECLEASNGGLAERWCLWALLWLIPLQFVVLLGWWLYQTIAVMDPGGWWNPLRIHSFATVVTQWLLALALFFLLNPLLQRQKDPPP